jgi:hypothetical protein
MMEGFIYPGKPGNIILVRHHCPNGSLFPLCSGFRTVCACAILLIWPEIAR